MARAKAKTTKTKAKAKTKSTAKKTTAKKTKAKSTVKKVKAKSATKKAKATKAKAPVKKVKTPKTIKDSALKKSEIYEHLTAQTGLTKKEVAMVFEELNDLVHRHMKKGAVGEFTVPGLMKLTVKSKPATKARKGINPFTGEEMTFKAKPARRIVKVRPLKKLKEMAE